MFDRINQNQKVLVEATIEEQDKEQFLIALDSAVETLALKFKMPFTAYEIIGYRKGSLVISMLMYAVPAFLLMRLFRKMLTEARAIVKDGSGLIADFRLEYRLQVAMHNARALKAYSQTNELVRKAQKSATEAILPIKEEDIKEVKDLAPFLKSFIVYPNALLDTKE